MRALLAGGLVCVAPAALGATASVASNDARATFQDGVFRLPALADPKDQYILTLSGAGDKPQVIALPAGATGLILGSNALPAGQWRWGFRLQSKHLPPVPLLTPDALRFSMNELAAHDDTVLLEWSGVEGAARYRVAVATSNDGSWGADAKTECRALDCVEPDNNTGHHLLQVKGGQRYRWAVAALDKDGIVIGQSEARTVDVRASPVAALQQAGWKLQRSDTISAKDAGKPALLSYVATQDAQTPRSAAYSAQLAVIWTAPTPMTIAPSVFARVSAETRRTSSGSAKAGDVTRLRAGAYGAPAGYNWSAALKHESAHKDNTSKSMLEASVTPLFGPLGRGLSIPALDPSQRDSAGNIKRGQWPLVQITPLLTLSADYGKTHTAGASLETGATIKRLRSDLRVDMLWTRAPRWLGVRSLSTYAEGSWWRLPGQATRHLAQAGISFGLTPEVSFDIAYVVGTDAPDFLFMRSTNVGLGIKF
jgi:hypothetical protein